MSNDLSRVLSRAVQPSVDVPPFWRIRPPGAPEPDGGVRIVLEAGPGFGDGAHETTQLCLQAMAAAPRAASARMLDFGSGSGVLSIGAARLGLSVDAVEIDAAAIEHAAHNAGLNGVASSIRVHRTLDALQGPYALVVANILRPVLLSFAPVLVSRLAANGTLVLSGLLSTDVPEIIARYSALLGGRRPTVHERGEWRAVVFWAPRAP